MNGLKRICVYCGASPGRLPVYQQAAQELGAAIARRGLALVYGGGTVGLMGTVARAVQEGGGQVIGIIPEALTQKELSGGVIGELIVVDTMQTRKARMLAMGDAFVALPGGFGTLEELFETVAGAQVGLHRKPTGLLNVAGYYNPLLAVVEQGIQEGFIRPQYRDLLVVEADPEAILDRLAQHQPPASLIQWTTPSPSHNQHGGDSDG